MQKDNLFQTQQIPNDAIGEEAHSTGKNKTKQYLKFQEEEWLPL